MCGVAVHVPQGRAARVCCWSPAHRTAEALPGGPVLKTGGSASWTGPRRETGVGAGAQRCGEAHGDPGASPPVCRCADGHAWYTHAHGGRDEGVFAVLKALPEVLAWWVALTGLWLVLISTVDRVELAVGALAALVAAFGARAARRAVRRG